MAFTDTTRWQKRVEWSASRLDRMNEEADSVGSSVASMLIVLILVYTAFAMVQGIISFSMNRVVGGVIFVVLAYDFLLHLTRLRVVAACLVGIIAVFGMGINTTLISDEIEFWIYWGCALLLLCYVARIGSIDDLMAACFRFRVSLAVTAVLASILIAALLFTHTGYSAEWGSGTYFSGLCNTKHTMASVCCLIMADALLCWRVGSLPNTVIYIVCAVATFALLQTGARTFLVPALVIWLFVVRRTIPWSWVRIIVIGLIAVTVIAVFATSGMADKFSYLSDLTGDDRSSAFSSGRTNYWSTDLAAFFSSSPLNQLFGNSASFVYDLNQGVFFMRIWAHNDFVMLLCAAGWCGLILYVVALRNFFARLYTQLNKKGFALLLLYVIFPAVINGFYSYQHLLYSTVLLICAVASTSAIPSRKMRRGRRGGK